LPLWVEEGFVELLRRGLDWLEPGRWTEKQIDKIAYVAVTRARQRLFIPYCIENSLIQRILDGL